MLNPISDDLDSKPLSVADGFLTSLPVRHDARQFERLRDPAAVVFSIEFNGKLHSFILRLARENKRSIPSETGNRANSEKD